MVNRIDGIMIVDQWVGYTYRVHDWLTLVHITFL